MKYLLLLGLLALSGCSTLFGDRFRDRADDYLTTTESKEAVDQQGQPLAKADALPIPALSMAVEQPDSFEIPQPAALQEEEENNEPQVASLKDMTSLELNPRLDRDGSGSQILRLDGNFAYAWAKVTDAIAASSLRMTDLNRSIGTWYLEIPQPAKEDTRSWWDRLWSSSDDEASQNYLLKMNRAHNGVFLSLLSDVDQLADDQLALSVFEQIQQQLNQ
ncbi:outer membrane protein assembly factor BamC [Oceanobacter mangrovi]|uniref:outer membrane protein assembly factor BamC n=1 Tax=Oceanobacter mangrovi TaxID=2862510 RepID=UPI001C8EC2C4|nr:outer membrane protein assembly factor BamC [Oceanobacter mangrovi]